MITQRESIQNQLSCIKKRIPIFLPHKEMSTLLSFSLFSKGGQRVGRPAPQIPETNVASVLFTTVSFYRPLWAFGQWGLFRCFQSNSPLFFVVFDQSPLSSAHYLHIHAFSVHGLRSRFHFSMFSVYPSFIVELGALVAKFPEKLNIL